MTQKNAEAENFATALEEIDHYLFCEGTHERAWEWLGSHPMERGGVPGTLFVVWAPAARAVSVVGDFNQWDGRTHPMHHHTRSGLWERFVPGVEEGACYKYEIHDSHGHLLPLKTDPFAFAMEHPPATASLVYRGDRYAWGDAAWMKRPRAERREEAISIYEVHLGSWRRVHEEGNRYLSYRELAQQLIPYVVDMQFTHIELLPVTEHPFDGSWGYQPIGLFAPSSRFGTPDDFKYFVDQCHQHDIGVIMDWVPGHFPTDEHGLARFDGTCLYEHQDPRQGFHPDWNTLIFNYGRKEVVSYLISNALFWLVHYHLDGLRFDAVASMLYLDYSRDADQWVPNKHGGRENLEALDFLKAVNERIVSQCPHAFTLAEESTTWPGVSRPVESGGLGFHFKWNMGWMNDTLRYMSRDPIHRAYHHNELTFGLIYAFSENFVLPLSHDEVVHGKGSLLARMPGDRWQQFANLRAYYVFMWTHPGKKLLFMGGELAQQPEWNHDLSLEWWVLDNPEHAGVQKLVRDLNTLYRTLPALHDRDCEPQGFQWLAADDSHNSVFAWVRRGIADDDPVVVVVNFVPVQHDFFRLGVPAGGFYVECLNSNSEFYGGNGAGNQGGVRAEASPSHGHNQSLQICLPPLSALVFRRQDALDKK